MLIRSYEKKDLKEMTVIWNEVVADGIAFPQEDILDETTGAAFFAEQSYCGAVWRPTITETSSDYISCTRTTSGAAVTSAMQATPSAPNAEVSISAKSLCWIAWHRQKSAAL